MKRRLFFFLTLLLITSSAAAQQSASHTAYLELFGNGGLYSLNYERSVTPQMYLRAGIGAWSSQDLWSDNTVKIVSVPLMANYLIGNGPNKFELGGGVLVGHQDDPAGGSGAFASLTGTIGYRHQAAPRGFLFRAGVTPFYGIAGGDASYPDKGSTVSVGISAGYAF